jgi:hypothetical protein
MTDAPNRRVYVDSNVLIYAVEGVPETAGPAKKLIAFLRAQKGLMFTSEITLAEVLAPFKPAGCVAIAHEASHLSRSADLERRRHSSAGFSRHFNSNGGRQENITAQIAGRDTPCVGHSKRLQISDQRRRGLQKIADGDEAGKAR